MNGRVTLPMATLLNFTLWLEILLVKLDFIHYIIVEVEKFVHEFYISMHIYIFFLHIFFFFRILFTSMREFSFAQFVALIQFKVKTSRTFATLEGSFLEKTTVPQQTSFRNDWNRQTTEKQRDRPCNGGTKETTVSSFPSAATKKSKATWTKLRA